jgi:hypothetical protein
MHASRLGRGTAAVLAACGIAGAGAGTAIAAPASPAATTAITVTIATRSGIPKIGGDTLVVFLSRHKKATISGKVTGAASGDTATLFAEPLHATTYVPVGQPVTLQPSGGTAKYSFKAAPSIATSYEVQVSGSGTATSPARTVYVTPHGTLTGKKSCSRPVCRIKLRLWVKLPAHAFQAESAKHWYLYSRLHLGNRSLPTILRLNHHATASRPRKLHAYEYVVTIRYKFRIGRQSYRWRVGLCTKDTETADGLGLPGHHGCGDKQVSATAYLG